MADIVIRIKAIDEFTKTFKNLENSLKSIQMPQMTADFGNVQRKIVQTFKPVEKQFNQLDEQTKAFQKRLDQMPFEPINRLDEALSRAGLSQRHWNEFLKQNNLEVLQSGEVWHNLTGEIMSQGKAVNLARIQSRRFKMEWLSVMFAGMALDRAFGGLIRTQMQLFGVTDLMGNAWTEVMLPIMELLTPIIYDLIDAFMSMPNEAKLAVGSFVLLMGAFGKFLGIAGQVVLAMMGLKLVGKDLNFKFSAIGYNDLISKVNVLKGIVAGGLGLAMFFEGVEDLESGKIIASMGDILTGIGLFQYAVKGAGGLWTILIGLGLKLLGDEDLLVDVLKFGMKAGRMFGKFLFLGFKTFLGL
ncbi:MAG: hypothetical protein ACTSUC_09640, partial [Promethearchaeota archaeon]